MRKTGPTISGFKDGRRGPRVKEHKWLLVIQCRFYHDTDMMSPTDQESIATEKRVCYPHISQEDWACQPIGGRAGEGWTTRDTSGRFRRQRE